MDQRKFRHFMIYIIVILPFCGFLRADADPPVLPITGEHIIFPSVHPVLDHRPRLSSVQQQQILNDVQQHHTHSDSTDAQIINFPLKYPHSDFGIPAVTNAFPSLAKYRVDRTKQQSHRGEQSLLQTAQTPYQLANRQNYLTAIPVKTPNTFEINLSDDTLQSSKHEQHFYDNQPSSVQLQTFYEKQRELELLQRQRDELISEQHALKRQQELLQFQRSRASSTTSEPITLLITTTTAPMTKRSEQSTTQSSILLASPTARRITPAESEIFLKAIATHQKKFVTTTTKPNVTFSGSTTTIVHSKQNDGDNGQSQEIPKDLLSLIQTQNSQLLQHGKNKPAVKIIYQTEKPLALQKSLNEKNKSFHKEQLLQQLKIALTENVGENMNITMRDLVLPNGRKLQVVHAPNGLSSIIPNVGSSQFQTVTQALDPSVSPSASTVRPVKTLLEQLTADVLPPGTDFEVLRHKADGKLEEIGNAPIQNQPGKKITFVVLEEQPDGSYKVQGVKGSGGEDPGSDIDSIVKKIQKGELKLPPSSMKNNFTEKAATELHSTVEPTTVGFVEPSVTTKQVVKGSISDPETVVSVSLNAMSSSSENYVTSASSPLASIYNSFSTHNPINFGPTPPSLRIGSSSQQSSKNHFIPTIAPVDKIVTAITPPSSTPVSYSNPMFYSHASTNIENHISIPTTPRIYTTTIGALNNAALDNLIIDEFQGRDTGKNVDSTINQFVNGDYTMANRLRREGLFAMAKYLRQSGLDSVLNETGPYTIFVPTDKAFRALLVQLGGPEKAEQKFRENPRLLSGLLLHHVIPGAFRSDALQEEMTGVSLAGTQLRVNIYDMHDHEWNDVKVITINGAKILSSKRDVEVPQGIAHAVDRVLFPLPVGDLIQTLAADREQRFMTFLKILHAARMDETLAGTKTFTVFAPTDAAFTAANVQNGRPVWTENDDAETAKVIASKHIMPTTLYTAGMRYYHQKNTLWPKFQLKIQRNGGRIRVNEAQVSTNNVPATNGVIHAIDAVL